jgi:hypothetical protein
MALTDHIDRNPEKQLLRGKIGYVHSWVLHGEDKSEFSQGVRILEKLPKVVFLKFEGATWTLPGLTEPGLYPVVPRKGAWFLDKGRKFPKLKISRQQLPLAPAFAITAHAAQGQTLPGAIVDLQIGRGTSSIASYVAITRVENRKQLLIYRPFDRKLFTGGSPEGPELLLKTLRGEAVDWKAIEELHTPHRRCTLCGFSVFKQDFLALQWNRKDGMHCCKACVEKKKEAGTPYECTNCHLWKAADAFHLQDLGGQRSRRVCKDCDEKRKCSGPCESAKSKGDFSEAEWRKASFGQGVCLVCMRRNRSTNQCNRCLLEKPREAFSNWAWKREAERVCSECLQKDTRQCKECGRQKPRAAFSSSAWTHEDERKCLACKRASSGQWKCVACKGVFPKAEFSIWLEPRTDKNKNDGRGRCNTCMKKEQAVQKQLKESNVHHLQK